MAPYLELLASGFPSFTRWVLADGVDGRIGVTTTSVETAGGCGHPDAAVGTLLSIDVDTLDDLDAAAAGFRRVHGHRLRIATKYHRLVREYLNDAGVADYQLVDSQGATEGTVNNETAEMIADITSTGETLRANHLKILSDGMVLQSQATLWRSRVAKYSKDDKAVLNTLLDLVDGG